MRAPLDAMKIRTAELDNSSTGSGIRSRLSHAASPLGGTFGKVRSSGAKPHQGWDLYAPVGTRVYSIGPGVVEFVDNRGDYGLQICIRLAEEPLTPALGLSLRAQLYAFYAHLSLAFFKAGQAVVEGEVIGMTGISGNARGVPPHLHFEIRTAPRPGKGMEGRIDPGAVLGYGYYSN